jgi:tetratricopeptide (TPR) repeat protein
MRPRISVILIATLVVGLAGHSVSGQSRVQELNESGWKALQDRRGDTAARLFAEALVLRPNDAVLMFGAGAAAYMQGRMPDALWRLRRTLEINPRLTEASRLLGEILYRSGDVDAAIATYEKALAHAPKEQDLVSALEGWRKDVGRHETFTERRDQMFTVLYDGRAEETTAVKTTSLLRDAYRRIAERIGVQVSSTIAP